MAIALSLRAIFNVYTIMILVNIFSSWLPEFRSHRLVAFCIFYSEPYLGVFRRMIPPFGMIDISPIVSLFALNFIEGLLLRFFI